MYMDKSLMHNAFHSRVLWIYGATLNNIKGKRLLHPFRIKICAEAYNACYTIAF